MSQEQANNKPPTVEIDQQDPEMRMVSLQSTVEELENQRMLMNNRCITLSTEKAQIWLALKRKSVDLAALTEKYAALLEEIKGLKEQLEALSPKVDGTLTSASNAGDPHPTAAQVEAG